jgi:hypothetical protein
MNVGSVTDVSEVLADSIFRTNVRRVDKCSCIYTCIYFSMKRPLLGKDRETKETTDVARQRSAERQFNSNRVTVFSVRSVPRCYTQDN